MKKFQFFLAVIIITVIVILATVSFFIVFADFSGLITTSMDTKCLAIFDVVFWLCGYIFAPTVRYCYDEWQEEKSK